MRLRQLVDRYRHARVLATATRTSSNFSRFVRNPLQFATLVGPVITHVLQGKPGPVRLTVFGCSYGPEPVSIASLLLQHRPETEFSIVGYDIDEHSVDFARRGVYEKRHVYNHADVDEAFVERTFDREGDSYSVKPAVRARIDYRFGDVTDADLFRDLEPSDIVFAQHVLYHLKRSAARVAFRNIAKLVPPHGALFVDGVDIDLRQAEAKAAGLQPFEHKIEEIHEYSRRTEWATRWPHSYYGLEPFMQSGEWQRRYATIYTRRLPGRSARGDDDHRGSGD